MRYRLSGVSTALIVAAGTVLVPATVHAAVPDVAFDHYVALGDSFSAGPLVPSFDSVNCARSTNNYPSTLAVKVGVYYEADSFDDVTCSSADTTHMTAVQHGALGIAEDPQLDALRPYTDLVTLGIGGNDESLFGTLVYDCQEYYEHDPQGNPCQQAFTVDGVDQLAAILPRTRTRIDAVVKEIKERSPYARVLLPGYPRLVPADFAPCDNVPMAVGDMRWADTLEQGLNRVIKEVAVANGATYVDNYTPSLGHDACAGADAWVRGAWTDITDAVSWHPNRKGMDAMARHAYAAINGIDLATGGLATASTTESGYAPSFAVDNDPYTRWASDKWRDGEWIKVDLGARKHISRLELNWEYAYAKGYKIEVSTDNSTWRTVWSTTNGDGRHDTVRFATTQARYVRLTGVTRATWYGISLWDFEVYSA